MLSRQGDDNLSDNSRIGEKLCFLTTDTQGISDDCQDRYHNITAQEGTDLVNHPEDGIREDLPFS
jgi:hypothetical protein